MAQQRRHEVAVILPGDCLAAAPAGVAVVEGSLSDEGAVSDVIDGRDAVLVATVDSDSRTETREHAQIILNVVRAMTRYDVRRLVVLSSNLVDPRRNHGLASWPLVSLLQRRPSQEAAEARRAEVIVRQSRLDWTLVRPSSLTDGHAQGSLRVGPGFTLADAKPTPRRMIADFMLDELERTTNIGHAVALAT